MIFLFASVSSSQSLSLPTGRYGISFGNSKNFTGLRFNIADKEVEEIKGINFTAWRSEENKDARVTGLSIGLGSPSAGYLSGMQLGGVIMADKNLKGISLGLLAAGAGNTCHGITLGGLAAGAGDEIHGITMGLLAAGAGERVVRYSGRWSGSRSG